MRTRSRRPGRPSLLTPERIDAIVRAAAVGVPTVLAAEGAGVSRSTIDRWMARGRAAVQARKDGEPADVCDDTFVELFQRVSSARAQMAAQALTRVLQAGAGSLVVDERIRTWTDPATGTEMTERLVRYLRPDWRAAAWWLTRVFPDQYGPNAASFEQLLAEFDADPPADVPGDPHLAELAERLAATLARHDLELPAPLPAAAP